MENVNDQNGTPVCEEPENLKKPHIGAFLLAPIWGPFNGIYWPLLVTLALGVIIFIQPMAAALANLVFLACGMYLMYTGRKKAWEKKNWDSVEHFNRVQRKWNIAGFVMLGLLFISLFAFFMTL